MSRYLTTNTLIENIKRRAMLPSNQNTFLEADFLAFANEEMDLGVVPHVLSFHEEYYVFTDSIELQPTTIRYNIPHRAIGNKLREVRYKDLNGNIFEMTQVAIEDEGYFQYNNIGSNPGSLRSFSIEGSEILLNTHPNTISMMGYLELMYYIRPNTLVSENRTAKVTSIVGNTVTIDAYSSAFNGITKFDITSIKNPHKLIAVDIEPIALATPSLLQFTFSEIPANIQIGDIIAISEETIIPQMPVELHSMLAQRVAIRCLEALGDTQGLQNATAKLVEMEQKTSIIIDNRVEGAAKKINNLHSHLRNSRKWYRR